MTACLVRLDRLEFGGRVFLYGAPRGHKVVRAIAAHASLAGPGFALWHGRTDIRLDWWSPTIGGLLSSLAERSKAAPSIVLLPEAEVLEEFAARTVLVAADHAWASPLVAPQVRQALLSHELDWYFLLYAKGQDLMVLALPRPRLWQTSLQILSSRADLLGLVHFTANLACAITQGSHSERLAAGG
jgi:hypothetical protein